MIFQLRVYGCYLKIVLNVTDLLTYIQFWHYYGFFYLLKGRADLAFREGVHDTLLLTDVIIAAFLFRYCGFGN